MGDGGANLPCRAQELEYETMHFGFSPGAFIDSVYNIFFDVLTESFNKMKESLLNMTGTEEQQRQREETAQKLLAKMQRSLDSSIENFQKSALSLFYIPDFVSLPADKAQNEVSEPVTSLQFESLRDEVANLEKECILLRYLKSQKEEEICLIKQLREQMAANDKALSEIVFAKTDVQIFLAKVNVIANDECLVDMKVQRGTVVGEQSFEFRPTLREFQVSLMMFVKNTGAERLLFTNSVYIQHPETQVYECEGQTECTISLPTSSEFEVLPVKFLSEPMKLPGSVTCKHLKMVTALVYPDGKTALQWEWMVLMEPGPNA